MALTTKRALAASLKKLLGKSTLDHITIKDIVEDCEVNRQTFYYHFHDIYDLMEWIFWDDVSYLAPNDGETVDWRDGLKKAFKYVLENKSLVMNTYRSFTREQLDRYIGIAVRPFVKNVVAELSTGLNIAEIDREFVIDLFTYALSGVLLAWVEKDMPEDYENQLDKFFLVTDTSIRAALGMFHRKE
ncbi:MAG: TetR-like C-terminal domain-containing protein [Smithellaceae bacterium]|nr:TetR-like C-terminal domain-containing protein [Smithellaceae bacterium]